MKVPTKRNIQALLDGVSQREAVEMVCNGGASVAVVSNGECYEELLGNSDTVSITIGPENITACANVLIRRKRKYTSAISVKLST